MPYLDQSGLTRLWDRMKAVFAPKSHTHAAGDIDASTLIIAPLKVPKTPPIASSSYDISIGDGAYIPGDASSDNVAIGTYSACMAATQGRQVAIGKQSISSGNGAVSIGQLSNAYGNSSVAIGRQPTAAEIQGIAIGFSSTVLTKRGIAIGQNSFVGYGAAFDVNSEKQSGSENASVAIGAYSVVNEGETDVVSFGNEGYQTTYSYSRKTAGSTYHPKSDAPYWGVATAATPDAYVGITRRLIHVKDPVNAQDAATKNYVDARIAAAGGAAADYVVAQGTCDFWTWRMWESGVAECWGSTGAASVPVTTAWGSLFEGPAHSNGFPGNASESSALAFSATVGGVKYSKLFCEAPSFCSCGFVPAGGAGISGVEVGGGLSATSTPTVYLLRPTAATVQGSYSYRAVGRWR